MEQYNNWVLGGIAIAFLLSIFVILIKRIFEIPEKYLSKEEFNHFHQEFGNLSTDFHRMDERIGSKIDRVHERIDDILNKGDVK